MTKPTLKIVDFNPKLPNVQAMNQKGSNEWTGRFCVKAVIVDNGDFTPEKNDPFEWLVDIGNNNIASGDKVYIIGWADEDSNFMVKDAEKYETGIEFNPENIDGSAMKIGGRFRNLDEFNLTIGVEKAFSDKDGQLYYGYWEIEYGAIEFMGDWGKIKRGETKLIDDNFPDDEPEEDPEEDEELEECLEEKLDLEILLMEMQGVVDDLMTENAELKLKKVSVLDLWKMFYTMPKNAIAIFKDKDLGWFKRYILNGLNSLGYVVFVLLILLGWVL